MPSPLPIRQQGSYRYVDAGPASELPPVVLLHGMLGGLDNWASTIRTLAAHGHRALAPVLPVYDLPLKETSVDGLVAYLHGFLARVAPGAVALVGNSLGGQVALRYVGRFPDDVAALALTGSSGLYEVPMGQSTLRRRDREYIRERAAYTFYDPVHATPALVDDIFAVVNDRARALRLIRMARSAQSEGVVDLLPDLAPPTLLVWGRDDRITPPDVGREFADRLPNAELHLLDECGHAPMMEHPETFNRLLLSFLERTYATHASPE